MSNYDDMKDITPLAQGKIVVIHHSADYDGIFSREIAKKFLPGAEIIGWDFTDEPLSTELLHGANKIYIIDLPFDRPFGITFKNGWLCRNGQEIQPIDQWDSSNIIWIDHHKTSIDTHPQDIPGYRIDGVAACRLAWQWFNGRVNEPHGGFALPSIEMFIERRLSEPLAVRLAGEYDIWDHRDPRALIFQFGLRSRELDVNDWENMLGNLTENSITVDGLLAAGKPLYDYQKSNDESTMKRSFVASFEGLNLLCLNTARCNSLTFASRDVPETGHDALCAFYWNGHVWTFSLYHAAHRKDLDLSEIARKHGGGGHRGACGFIAKSIPFQPHAI